MTAGKHLLVTILFLISLELCWSGCSSKAVPVATDVKSNASQSTSREAVISSAEQTAQGIEVEVVKINDLPGLVSVPGHIALPDNAVWRVGVLTDGRIETVNANLGDYVHKGEILARMHSHDVHDARAAYQLAVSEQARLKAAAALAQKEYERAQRLYALKAASVEQTEIAKQEVINAQTAVQNAEFTVIRERTHLEETLGIPADVPANSHTEENDLIPIVAPASGYILQKNVTPGATILPSTDAFVIADLHRLWMLASVDENKLAQLQLGQPATVTLPDLPGQSFAGRVTNLGQEFEPTTRRMQIRIELDNKDNRLRPEMLAKADLPVGESRSALLIPQDAIQQVNGQDSVFVRTSPDRFVMHPVQTGEAVQGMVQISSGIKPGDQVVTHGSFLVKSQLLRSTIGD